MRIALGERPRDRDHRNEPQVEDPEALTDPPPPSRRDTDGRLRAGDDGRIAVVGQPRGVHERSLGAGRPRCQWNPGDVVRMFLLSPA